MHLHNGEHGYGVVTRTLHWLTVALLTAQVVVGLTMTDDDHGRRDRFEQMLDRREDAAKAQGKTAERRFEEEADRLEDAFKARAGEDVGASALHIGLGLSVLALGLARLLWRRTTALPPWAEHLSVRERSLEAWLEKGMLALLLLVPASGLLLLLVGSDWVAVHVTAQLLLLAVVAVHVGLVLKHTVLHRHRHLSRMA